ncbi:MAG: hypothetical protein HY655_05025 [Acidobacteria bacterium]|nr:hypothetical protein [Acidobacteriota bacterium]
MQSASSGSGNEQPIPRVIHRIWLGGGPVPRIFDHYEQSWRKHHPEWEMRLWREDTLPPLSCQAEYDAVVNIKRCVDIARLEILRQCGGVFVDMDVEALRPLDPLLRGVSAFVGRVGDHHVGNQVLGAVPHHPFFERAVARLASSVRAGGTSSKVAGKAFLSRVLREQPEGVTVFPSETFYFEPSFEPPRRPDDFPHVYAVHHEVSSYAGAPPASVLDRRFRKFRRMLEREIADVQAGRGDGVSGRLQQAEEWLRLGVSKNERGFRAQLRRAEAEREQAEARLRQAQLDARCRIEELETQLAAFADRLARLERRSLVMQLRKLAASVFRRSGSV